MFYSQTFLARKGPLGTVWCAAHLQHRLKKSHYTTTDIPSTVDRIMFPEVPIALRMSGHLLLGVVRIYSKKVDYLFHDCNAVLVGLRKAFASIDINLPEQAMTAKFESVTLPQVLDLDALDVDDSIYPEGSPDSHLRSWEEITLLDQIPFGRDPYVAISFDEDVMMDILPLERDPSSGVRPMEEGSFPLPPVDSDVGIEDTVPSNQTEIIHTGTSQDPGPSNETGVLTGTLTIRPPGLSNQTEELTEIVDLQDPGSSNQTEVLIDNNSPPEIERMRDAVHDFVSGNLPPVSLECKDDATKTNRSSDQILNDDILAPITEDAYPSGRQSLPFQQHLEPPTSYASQDTPEIFDTHVSFGHVSPELALRSTPPVQQPQPRPRKRKHFFDESTVLTNKFMKKALEDCSDLLRKRRATPLSALGIWKLNNNLRKEQVFCEPSINGLCAHVCNLSKKDYISTKPQLTLEQEPIREPSIATSPVTSVEPIPDPRNASSPAPKTQVIPEPRCLTSPAASTEVTLEPTLAQLPEGEGDAEIERLRHDEGHGGNDNLAELLPSPARIMPSPGRFMPSPFRRDDFTPNTADCLGFEELPQAGTTTGTGLLATPDIAASTGTCGSELETPMTFFEERLGAEKSGLSDIPELMNTAEAEDLYFLEADNTPAGSQGTQGIDSLSVRTRAVAQYLKRQSPITPMSEDPSGDLSLNKILQGRTRKLCARMFFETLVLKSYGLIDVQQEQPYGDIILKLTPTLSKAQI